MSSIGLDRVRKVHENGFVAVRDVTLEIEDGELMVMVGPSGSGKSTVLRLIAGLDTPTSGRIVIDGRDVTQTTAQSRDLAMVFQNYALYPHKTVRQNLEFGLRMRHIDRDTIAARVQRAASVLGIDALLDRRPAQLSGGQRQRVALGRAIVREPRAFLLDEPLSNLDPRLRAGTRAELALLHRNLAATMVYVTHDQEEALTLGTRIAVMRDGVIDQVGTPVELFQRPASTFVAGFVGSPAMNLLPCMYSAAGDRLRLSSRAFTLELDDTVPAGSGSPSALLGVRPHDIDVVSPGDADAVGRVEIVEMMGSTTLIHVRVDGLAESTLRVVVPSDAHPVVNQGVGIRLRRHRLHLFDARDGRRLNQPAQHG